MNEGVGTIRRAHRLSRKPEQVCANVSRAPVQIMVKALSTSQLDLSRCQAVGNNLSKDAIILAGDVTDDLETFAATLHCFTEHWQVWLSCSCYATLLLTDWVSDICSMSFLYQEIMICGHERQREAN